MNRVARKQAQIDIDDLDHDQLIEPCRDEDCPVIGLHAIHTVISRRGRIATSCPNCFKPIKKVTRSTVACTSCHWSRTKKVKTKPKTKKVNLV